MSSLMRRATPADIPAIRELRLSVGWQAHDWALHDAMEPPHAAFFAMEEGGRLVAIGSGIAYRPLGIVGNMVVAADRRRRGLGSRILGEVLAFLETRGAQRVELYATPDGRRLYERFGFTRLAVGSMIELGRERALAAAVDPEIEVRLARPTDLLAIAAYDRPRYGGDRMPILQSALRDPARPVLLALRAGELGGYAVLRPAGTRLGPWVADDTRSAGALLSAVAADLPPDAVIATMIPGENVAGRSWLADLGATSRPMGGRMARAADLARRLETIYGNVMGALG
jgi:GNAT superfamily N-acetyltransferase